MLWQHCADGVVRFRPKESLPNVDHDLTSQYLTLDTTNTARTYHIWLVFQLHIVQTGWKMS